MIASRMRHAIAFVVMLIVAGPAAAARGAPADEQTGGRAGFVVRVPLPIAGSVDQDVIRQIDRLLTGLPAQPVRPVLVLEFAATKGQTGRGSQFERCLALARYLSGGKLARLRTVAYLPGTVEGHAVLPVLACEEIIMHGDAELGAAGIDEQAIDDTLRQTYREIAERRRVIPPAVALGMLDRQLAVYRVRLEGVRYVLDDELRQLQARGQGNEAETIKQSGQRGLWTGQQLRHQFRLVSHLVRGRKELARVLHVKPEALQADPSLGRAWQAVRVDLRGPIGRRPLRYIHRSLSARLRDGQTNFVCLWLDTPGGSPEDSVQLAFLLAEQDPAQVRTVAFVPRQARGDAALIALACDQLVMQPGAILGGPGAYQMSRRELEDLRQTIKQLAGRKQRSWSWFAALVDPSVQLRGYRHSGTGRVQYFCEEELGEQPDRQRWQPLDPLQVQQGLRADRAAQLGLARDVVDDFEQFRQLYRLEQTPPVLRPPQGQLWVEQLAEFLASPLMAAMLLFGAWFFLSAELSHPGLSAPGFAAAVCFLLFFWSQFLHGTADWLEILLFVTGLVCVALEIFVIPGIGAFGIGGTLMIIIAIVLASQTFVIPRNSYQLHQMPASLMLVVATISGIIVSFLVMRRLLPGTPFFHHVMLQPPQNEEAEELSEREALVHLEYLEGKQGVATTPLRPAGKARFGDDVVDVVSRGESIPRGADVSVVEVRGSRVVVVPVEQQ